MAEPQDAKAQGIEDINSDTQIDLNSNDTTQTNVSGNAPSQTNLNSTFQASLFNTADALPVTIVNNLDIVTVNPGEAGINAQSLGTATSTNLNSTTQSNVIDFSNSDPVQEQGPFIQANVNETAVLVDHNTALADSVSVDNQANITADGDGVNALSQALGVVITTNSSTQSNQNQLAGDAQNLAQSQIAQQDNENATEILVTNQALAADVSVWNVGTTTAGLNGVNAASVAIAATSISTTVSQTNTNEMVGAGNNIDQFQQVEQDNLNEEAIAVFTYAQSGEVVVFSADDPAGGDSIAATSAATAVATVSQVANQTNTNSQSATAGGDIDQDQDLDQENSNAQYGVAIAVATSDLVLVQGAGYLSAGENGINASSSAQAVASVEQTVSQNNSQTQTENGVQHNESEQQGLAVAVAISDDVAVTQQGKIKAGKDGINASSVANAAATVDQEALQSNSILSQQDNYFLEQSGPVPGGTNNDIAALVAGYAGYDVAGLNPDAFAFAAADQVPDAFAFAAADQVYIGTQSEIVAGGTGIVATSYAQAIAAGDDPAAVAISGDVNVVVNGDVEAGATGIYAASIADAETSDGTYEFEQQGNVKVVVQKGEVEGGYGYYGIEVQGGHYNVIEIDKEGAVTSESQQAILGGDQNETVYNYGLVFGDVDLDGGSNAFFNYESGKFYSGSVINLNGGLLFNEGLLSPGGPGVIQTSELNGDLEQSSSGKYAVDVNMGEAKADRIDIINGGTADLDGEVEPTLTNPVAGTQKITILTADGGVIDNGIDVNGDTPLVDYSLKFPDDDVVLKIDVNFAPNGLANGLNGVGQHLNNVFKNGVPNSMEPLAFALLQLPTVRDVSNAYNQLSGASYGSLEISELYSQERFSEDQMSCPVRGDNAYVQAPIAPQPLKLGGGDSGQYGVPGVVPFIGEDQCVWARVRWRGLQQDANSGTTGFDEDAVGVTGGAQWALNGPWYAGVSLGYENSQIDTNAPFLNSDGDRFRVGGSLKYISGRWFVGGAITGGWSNFDSTRQISFPGFASVVTSDQDLSNVAGLLRVAYQVGQGAWYLKPLVDLNVTNVDMDSFTERGGNGAALRVASNDETVFSATPALEIGTQWGHPGGTLVRPYVRGGVSFYSDADFPITAGFAAAPGVAPFTTNGEIDDVLGNVSAGVSFLGAGGGVLTFGYDGRFGDTFEEHSASAKASIRF